MILVSAILQYTCPDWPTSVLRIGFFCDTVRRWAQCHSMSWHRGGDGVSHNPAFHSATTCSDLPGRATEHPQMRIRSCQPRLHPRMLTSRLAQAVCSNILGLTTMRKGAIM